MGGRKAYHHLLAGAFENLNLERHCILLCLWLFEIQKKFCSYPSPFVVRKNLEFSRTIWWGCVSGEFHLVISALFKFWLNFLSWALDYALMAKSTAFPFGFSSCKYQPFKTCASVEDETCEAARDFA